jgi:hypothetical protein
MMLISIASMAKLYDRLSKHLQDHTEMISKNIMPHTDAGLAAIQTVQRDYDREWELFSNAIPRLDRLFALLERERVMEGNERIETVKNVRTLPSGLQKG